MTFSILARDEESGAIGGAAATGSLCVGGWVLRGHALAGMSASQGMAPSTFWGEDVLEMMANGQSAEKAVRAVTEPDAGRAQRQLSALPLTGPGAAYTGKSNTPVTGERLFPGGIAAGNMLAGPEVVDALADGFLSATGSFPERLLAGLRAAESAGSDSRGLLSAALLVVSPAHAPLTLRIDHAEHPLAALEDLLARATSGDYADWARQVPCLDDPERIYGG
ncbi:DUF1028 domain-containing protein [Sinisalibacter aestuarii]|uniref:DUF1028 domain-containing protein n=1 Tax=Sinisalibacter aestuarii TaxID=2949426 RepID=A0ABQ5LZT4_9RHOB|nr:DUF1028 domain-containing protein [Sinisalibacter aestuarii]GKY90243.1 hypothetical protein STA1M1_41120 [Sinisalibacter aestuarii]